MFLPPEFEPGTIAAFGLFLVRTSVLVLTAPLLGQGSGFAGYKVGLILILGFVFYAVSGEPLPEGTDNLAWAALAVREALIGFSLSFVLRLFVLIAHVAGEMVGHEMAMTISRQADPETGVNSPLIARIYENFFLLGLLAVNGHHWLLRALGDSFERAPVGQPGLDGGTQRLMPMVAQLFTEMFAAGLTFAAPVMVLLIMTSILIGLLSRAVPYVNVLEMSFNIRILLATVAMFLFAPLLEPVMIASYESFADWLGAALDVLEG